MSELPPDEALALRRAFMEMLEEGLLDDLAEPDVMAGAWDTPEGDST
ncbi:hypothetical protein [Streptomyces sp. SYSU K21746]